MFVFDEDGAAYTHEEWSVLEDEENQNADAEAMIAQGLNANFITLIFGIVGALNYRKVATDADNVLAVLEENGGIFPDDKHPRDDLSLIDGLKQNDHRFSSDLSYESRCFSLFLTEDGTVISLNTGKFASVDTAAANYAQAVASDRLSKGFTGGYLYTVY